jgi:hypothetical protein
MELKPKNNCPLNGFAECKQFDCAWFVHILGKHPQQDKEIDEFACAISWLPILLIENAQMSRQTGAAVESFRNEMAQPGNNMIAALMETLNTLQQVVTHQSANIMPMMLSAMAARRIETAKPDLALLKSDQSASQG